jgi:hypothetical protein
MDFLKSVFVFVIVSVIGGLLVAVVVRLVLGRRHPQFPNPLHLPLNLDALTNFIGPAILIGPTIGITPSGVGVIAGPIIAVVQAFIFGGPQHATFQDPLWNVWAEQAASSEVASPSPAFTPTNLEPNRDYSLVINLAGLRLGETEGKMVFSKETSSAFAQWLEQNRNVPSVDLNVVALVDSQYFELRDSRAKTFSVDLAKIGQARDNGFEVPKSPFEYLRSQGGKAPFSFGLQSFHIRTLDRTGSASIAISVWADGKPIDELTLTLCITAAAAEPACKGKLSASNPLAGVDLTMRGIYPDMALHLIDRKSGVAGVLRCNSCGWSEGDYREWEFDETADWVSQRMVEILNVFAKTAESKSLTPKQVQQGIASVGRNLYNVIFHSRKPDNAANSAFVDFVAKAQAMEKDGKAPPALFVRIIPERQDLRLAPVGLMYVKAPGAAPDFVGFSVNVQTPLEYQDYSPSPDCISRWVLFVPPETPPPTVSRLSLRQVLAARQPFQDWIAATRQSCPDCVIDDETDFDNWLSRPGPRENLAIAILSHHSNNALFFNEDTKVPQVMSSAITRLFGKASIVILDACGTSEPGASEFIRQFNRRGVMSAIATSTRVDPVLAGKFLATFMTLLQQHANDPNYTVSQARFDAVRKLAREKEPSEELSYGPRALAFVLAGNGALRLCAPH